MRICVAPLERTSQKCAMHYKYIGTDVVRTETTTSLALSAPVWYRYTGRLYHAPRGTFQVLRSRDRTE